MLIEFIQPDFQFEDARGCLKQLIHDGWKQVNYISSVAGAFRGNHWHQRNKEAFFVISGRFDLSLEHTRTHEEESYLMKAGDFFIIPPNVSHSFLFTDDTQLISLYDEGVENEDGSKDIQHS